MGQYVSTLAGTGQAGHQDGPGPSALFTNPHGVAMGSDGSVFVADLGNNRIRKITPDGEVSTYAGNGQYGFFDGSSDLASFRYPSDVAVDSLGNVYVADNQNHAIRKIDLLGNVTTVAGDGNAGYQDGGLDGTVARFNFPTGIDIDSQGNIYVADRGNHRVRVINSAGEVSTLAGSTSGYFDGGHEQALFNDPADIAVNASDLSLIVVERDNHTVRRISLADTSVTTIAGNGAPGNLDGFGTAASFHQPYSVCIDGSGVVYIADKDNHRIRKLSENGEVTTVAGNSPGYADGFQGDALFYRPIGVTVSGGTELVVADYANQRIRHIDLEAMPNTSENIQFSVAGGHSVYNIPSTGYSGLDGLGGLTITGDGFDTSYYYLEISFNQGDTWQSLQGGTSSTGLLFDAGGVFEANESGYIYFSISHATISSLSGWPGNSGTVSLRASNFSQSQYYPNSSGRTIQIDLVPPTIIYTSIESSNSINTTRAGVDHTVVVSIISSEPLKNNNPLTGSINGYGFSSNGNTTNWTSFRTITDNDPEGSVTFDIYCVDASGNMSETAAVVTTDESSVFVDRTPPSISNVSIVSSNTDNTIATTGDTVQVSLLSSEGLYNLSNLSIASQTVYESTIQNVDGLSWGFYYVMEGGDIDGDVQFTVSCVDSVGNVTFVSAANTGSVVFNADPMILNITTVNPSGDYNQDSNIDITMEFIENIVVDGSPLLYLNTGTEGASAVYSSGSGTKVLTFVYDIVESDSTINLTYTGEDALVLNGGQINDLNGNAANLILPLSGEENSLSSNRTIVLDNYAPYVSSVSAESGTWKLGESRYVFVDFSENIFTTGTPSLELNIQNYLLYVLYKYLEKDY